MVQYILPLTINDRRIHFAELNEVAQGIPESFIMEVPNLNSFRIFSIPKKASIQALIAKRKDILLAQCSFEVKFHHDTLEFIIHDQLPKQLEQAKAIVKDYEDIEEEDIQPVSQESLQSQRHEIIGLLSSKLQLEFIEDQTHVNLIARVLQAPQEADFAECGLHIHIHLHAHEQTYVQQLKTYLVHPAEYLGLALDFGSEASQMAVKRYTHLENMPYRQEVESVKLFEHVYNYHVSKLWLEKEHEGRYLQKERDTNFYKSIFFIKKTLEGFDENYVKQHFIVNEKDNFKMLVKEGVVGLKETYHQLPNLKIIHHYDEALKHIHFDLMVDNYPIDVSLKEIKSKTYATILKTFFASILKKEFIKYKQNKYISITLLVPNIYDAYDIRMTKLQVHEIFTELAKHEFEGRIKAWEIITLSESDASFIGYLNKNEHQIKPNKDYIVIDCGKGTTDFSIIRSGQKNIFDLKPIYRNGFAGAGNLISYSIFETILHFIREHAADGAEAKQFIREKMIRIILGNDLKLRNDFYAEIERLKFNFSKQATSTKQQWEAAKSGDISLSNMSSKGAFIETITDILSQVDQVADFYGYIDAACEMIVHNIIDNIKIIKENKTDFDCGGVLLSGRSFLFAPLQEKLALALQQEIGIAHDQIITLKQDELKEICIKGIFRDAVQIHPELIGYPLQIVKRKEASDINQDNKSMPSFSKSKIFSTILMKLLGDQSDGYIPEVIFKEDGKLDYTKMSRSTLLIGNKNYAVKGNEFYSNGQHAKLRADIQFTSDGYYVRRFNELGQIDNISEIQQIGDIDSLSQELLIPSLFPATLDERYLMSMQRNDIEKLVSNIPNNQPDEVSAFMPSTTEETKVSPTMNNDLYF